MSPSGVLFFIAAVVIHAAILLFGGLLFMHEEQATSKRDVEIVSEDVNQDKEEAKPEEQKPEEIKEQEEQPPDANQALPSTVDQVSTTKMTVTTPSALRARISDG